MTPPIWLDEHGAAGLAQQRPPQGYPVRRYRYEHVPRFGGRELYHVASRTGAGTST